MLRIGLLLVLLLLQLVKESSSGVVPLQLLLLLFTEEFFSVFMGVLISSAMKVTTKKILERALEGMDATQEVRRGNVRTCTESA